MLLALSVVVIFGAAIFSIISLDNYFRSRMVSELSTQAHQAEFVVRTLSVRDTSGYSHLQQYAQAANIRLTLIDHAGMVVFESELPPSRLGEVENHMHRPEVQEARRIGIGSDVRKSTTLDVDLLYLAEKIEIPFPNPSGLGDTEILRVAIPLTNVNEVMSDIRSKIMGASAIMLGIIFFLALLVSKRISSPIEEMVRIAEAIQSGDLQKRIPVRSNDEFGKLSVTLNSMVDTLNSDIDKLTKLERVRTQFLGNVSHELRTPIFAIQGMLETLLQGALEDTEVRRDFVQRALANTQRLDTLLGDLIEISRVESGDMKMSFRYFALRPFLSQLLEELQPLALEKHISLSLMEGDDNIEVVGDKERLKQVMINLINNAMKYSPEHTDIKLSFAKRDSDVIVAVNDSGIGIGPEHLPRIFERFYRVDKERSRDAGGTGLGLAIVKHIVEAHGSTIEVQSEIGKGSTFSFSLKT